MTSLPAFSVMATVTGVVASFHPLGRAPTVVRAAVAERPVVRRQDLLVEAQAQQGVPERAPLAHARAGAVAVAVRVDVGVGIGGRRCGGAPRRGSPDSPARTTAAGTTRPKARRSRRETKRIATMVASRTEADEEVQRGQSRAETARHRGPRHGTTFYVLRATCPGATYRGVSPPADRVEGSRGDQGAQSRGRPEVDRSRAARPGEPGRRAQARLRHGPGRRGVHRGPARSGTLYGAIARLEARGLIEALDDGDSRRRPYRLTARGVEVLERSSPACSASPAWAGGAWPDYAPPSRGTA